VAGAVDAPLYAGCLMLSPQRRGPCSSVGRSTLHWPRCLAQFPAHSQPDQVLEVVSSRTSPSMRLLGAVSGGPRPAGVRRWRNLHSRGVSEVDLGIALPADLQQPAWMAGTRVARSL
jgi:hypothetical protein